MKFGADGLLDAHCGVYITIGSRFMPLPAASATRKSVWAKLNWPGLLSIADQLNRARTVCTPDWCMSVNWAGFSSAGPPTTTPKYPPGARSFADPWLLAPAGPASESETQEAMRAAAARNRCGVRRGIGRAP